MNLPGYQERLDLLGNRLRTLRRARGLSLRLADQVRARYDVKLDPSYLSRVERGRAALPLRTLCALADYFAVEPAALLFAEGSPPVPHLSGSLGALSPEEFRRVEELLRQALALVSAAEEASSRAG